MSDQRFRVGAAVAAVALILIGVLTTSWWTFEEMGVEIRIGLRKVALCAMEQCLETSYKALASGTGASFRACAAMTYWGGLIAAVVLAIGVFLRETQDNDKLARTGGGACALVAVLSVFTVISFPDVPETTLPGGASFELSLSYGFYFTLLGGLLGGFAGLMSLLSSTWEGKTYVPVDGDRLPSAKVVSPPAASAADAPEQARGAAAAATGAAQQRQELSQMVADPSAVPVADRYKRNPKRPSQRVSDAPIAAVDALRGSLRFVARSCEVSSVGMSVVFESGQQRDLLWSDVNRLVARTLPPDPPFEKTAFMDIVPAPLPGRPLAPIRLLPSTRVNYGALPGGAGMSSKENFRKLAALIRETRPNVIEPVSEGFFLEGKAPPLFMSVKLFADYDAQYSE